MASHQKQEAHFEAENSASEGEVQLNGKGPGSWSLGLGIQGILVSNVLHPNTEDICRAYVFYFHSDAGAQGHQQRKMDILKAVPPPNGYAQTSLKNGYLFVKTLPTLKEGAFADPKLLETHFTNPFSDLLDWWEANLEALSKIG